ncbi:TetR/AcrR family transcriptional regulator [Mycolicibacterium boenickei]
MPRPDRSRTALMQTAGSLFRRQGYAATGINQILAEAQVKPGSLYHHFPDGKQQLAAAVVEVVGGDIESLLRKLLSRGAPVADVVDGWINVLAAGLAADERDGCPVEPIATESVHSSPLVRDASAKVFAGWSNAVAERLTADGWASSDADRTGLAVVALIEGALILSRVAGNADALHAAQVAARSLLTGPA